jgi:deoxycytidylate deaminase
MLPELAPLITYTTRRIDLKHLLSAERASRGSFYATRVGFVAINAKGHRFARAHNGFPIGVTETRDRWSKGQKDFYHLHAECAGVFHAVRYGYACEGATAYVTHPPCPGCMRVLISSGFARVVFSEQALLERLDWREDMQRSFALAQEYKMELGIYRDKERSLKNADITRTEKVYDNLLPQARWSSGDVSEISRATKPECGDWVEQPVVKALLECAKKGIILLGKTVLMDYLPECRAATALIQAGVKDIIVKNKEPDCVDARWAVPLELQRAEELLKQDAKIEMRFGDGGGEVVLDATRK